VLAYCRLLLVLGLQNNCTSGRFRPCRAAAGPDNEPQWTIWCWEWPGGRQVCLWEHHREIKLRPRGYVVNA